VASLIEEQRGVTSGGGAIEMLERINRERELRRQRDQKIVEAWELGESYVAIGRTFGMSRDNAKNRIERYYREQQRQKSSNPFDKLSSRTLKILQHENITTISMVVDKYQLNELLSIRNFGCKSLREIEMLFPVSRSTSAARPRGFPL